MYLVGVLRLSRSQKTLLERRNIVPVDMSECPGIADDHYKAFERFFAYLQSRRIDDSLGWPIDPDTPAPPNRESEPSVLAQTWKQQRRLYPGWVIVPEDRRRALWLQTKRLIQDPPATESLSHFIDLEYAFELTWRMEKCLCPLFVFNTQVQFLETTLDRYWPFAGVDGPIESLSPNQTSMKARGLTRREVRHMVHHLLLALMRYYREQGLSDDWQARRTQLEKVKASLSPEHTAHLHYECAMLALFELDVQKLKTCLEEWPDNPSLSFWSAKKAGLLAEVGQMDKARNLLKHALDSIRDRLNLTPTTTDFSLVSAESFVMLLLSCTQRPWFFNADNEDRQEQALQKQFSERWHSLKQFKCDPWNELDVFERALDRPQSDQSSVKITPTFDIGYQARTDHLGNWDHDALIAYSFLRFSEDVGLPFRMPGRIIATKSAKGALVRIANYSQAWSNTIVVRINDKNSVDHIFDRSSLARMDVSHVDNLAKLYLRALNLAASDINAGNQFRDFNFGIVLATVVPEILSRFCSKCSEGVKEQLIDFLIGIYHSDKRGEFRGIKQLLRRLIESLSHTRRVEMVPKLLEFPILSGLNPIEAQEYVNPLVFFDKTDVVTARVAIDQETWGHLIEHLSSSNLDRRVWALASLQTLYDLRLLNTSQEEQFANALWHRLDENGLPVGTKVLYRHELLTLPHPIDVDPVALFKEYVLQGQFPLQKDAESIRIGQSITVCIEICGASDLLEWSDEDAHSIVCRLLEWWDNDKEYLTRSGDRGPFGSISDEFNRRFSWLVNTLIAINPGRGAMRESMSRLVDEFSDYGVSALRLEAACLDILPDRRGRIVQSIEDGLASSTKETVSDALRAVAVISKRAETDSQEANREVLFRLLQAASQILQWRSKTGLPLAIGTVAHVIRMHPWTFVEDIERPLLLGLRCMIVETEYARSTPLRGRGRDEIDTPTKLLVRREAAALAFTLYNNYVNQRRVVPDVIARWQAICKSDHEFAEIRNQWSQGSSI